MFVRSVNNVCTQCEQCLFAKWTMIVRSMNKVCTSYYIIIFYVIRAVHGVELDAVKISEKLHFDGSHPFSNEEIFTNVYFDMALAFASCVSFARRFEPPHFFDMRKGISTFTSTTRLLLLLRIYNIHTAVRRENTSQQSVTVTQLLAP